MEQLLFITLLTLGIIAFFISMKRDEHAVSIYKIEVSLLSLVIFATLSLASFNIEIYHFAIINNVATTYKEQVVDMAYFGISLAFTIFNLLNIIILMWYDTFISIFGIGNKEE